MRGNICRHDEITAVLAAIRLETARFAAVAGAQSAPTEHASIRRWSFLDAQEQRPSSTAAESDRQMFYFKNKWIGALR